MRAINRVAKRAPIRKLGAVPPPSPVVQDAGRKYDQIHHPGIDSRSDGFIECFLQLRSCSCAACSRESARKVRLCCDRQLLQCSPIRRLRAFARVLLELRPRRLRRKECARQRPDPLLPASLLRHNPAASDSRVGVRPRWRILRSRLPGPWAPRYAPCVTLLAAAAHGEFQGIDDMITLNNMTEESMLKNLQIRYAKDIIYVRSLCAPPRSACSYCASRPTPARSSCPSTPSKCCPSTAPTLSSAVRIHASSLLFARGGLVAYALLQTSDK